VGVRVQREATDQFVADCHDAGGEHGCNI
jgi:hypothetical protein